MSDRHEPTDRRPAQTITDRRKLDLAPLEADVVLEALCLLESHYGDLYDDGVLDGYREAALKRVTRKLANNE